jgi:hypothetical protein
MDRGRGGSNAGGRSLASTRPTVSTVLPGLASAFVACLATPGCYLDPINAAPVAHIVVITGDIHNFHIPDDPKPRFSCTTSTDPDGDTPTCSWEFHTCPSGQACLPRGYGLNDQTQVDLLLAKGLEHAPVQVRLTVKDSHGATATDSLIVEPVDLKPTIEVVAAASNLKNRHGNFTVGRKLTLQATPDDPDTGDVPEVTWSIVTMPSGPVPETNDDLPVVGHTWSYVIRPDRPGTWVVQGLANDHNGQTETSTIEFTVEDDLPPCIEAREPDAPVAFPVVVHRAGGLRTFRVDSVEDDLDTYPFSAEPDDRSGETHFQWSTGAEGTPPQAVIGQVTSAFTLDPSTLPLGERLIVRVDAHDRVERTCAADSPTCASEPDGSCLSRYSWTVEVR